MSKKESHYFRLFRYIMIIILLVVAIFGILIVSICSKMFENSELRNLKNIGNAYLGYVNDAYISYTEMEYYMDRVPDKWGDLIQQYDGLRKNITNNYNINICLYDIDGKCMFPNCENHNSIDYEIRKYIDNNTEILELYTASLSQNEPYMIYGTRTNISRTDENAPLYIVLYGGTDKINSFTIRTAIFYLVLASISLVACYILIRIRFRKYISFEEDFKRITEKYSKGDFSEKLSTDLSPNLQYISEHINTLAANVEKSEEISSTFIANVSHELRTPITTIGGFVDGILDGTIKKSRQQEYLILVSQEIQRLRILITSMLNMSKFESGTMSPNFVETNLTDLVIKVVLMFEKRIEEKELQVEELDSSRLIAIADPDLMQQVIYNLVENAVKFINRGGTLSFSFDKKDDICIIGIRNTGEGLKDSEIPQVFNRFYKTDSSRGKDKTGLGLGLSISRKIVHLHNGHIVVKSVYGEYTEFQIQIPEDPRLVAKDKKE